MLVDVLVTSRVVVWENALSKYSDFVRCIKMKTNVKLKGMKGDCRAVGELQESKTKCKTVKGTPRCCMPFKGSRSTDCNLLGVANGRRWKLLH